MYIDISYLLVLCHTFSLMCSLAFVILPVSHVFLVGKLHWLPFKKQKKNNNDKKQDFYSPTFYFKFPFLFVSFFFLTQKLTPHLPIPPHPYPPPVLSPWDAAHHT